MLVIWLLVLVLGVAYLAHRRTPPWTALGVTAGYLLLMGLYILSKAYRHVIKRRAPRHVAKLALFGGFVDAAGGGGWGPVVTSSLLGR